MLKRYVPAVIAREVRRRCGFGCVVCGNAIIDYDHFDPEFKNARSHTASGIVLLCLRCHGRKGRGWLSRATILKHLSEPSAVRRGFSSEEFDVGTNWPEVQLGPIKISLGNVILNCNGHDVLSIDEPEAPGAPFRLNATFRDHAGEITLQIVNNEWRVRTGNWDAVQEGDRLVIRRGLGDIVLVLRTAPPDKLIIERLNMRTEDYRIVLDGEELRATTPAGKTDILADIKMGGGNNSVCIGPHGILLNVVRRSDFSEAEIGTHPSSDNSLRRSPPPYTGRGFIEFGETPTKIGGGMVSGVAILGGGVRAHPDGGIELFRNPDPWEDKTDQ